MSSGQNWRVFLALVAQQVLSFHEERKKGCLLKAGMWMA